MLYIVIGMKRKREDESENIRKPYIESDDDDDGDDDTNNDESCVEMANNLEVGEISNP